MKKLLGCIIVFVASVIFVTTVDATTTQTYTDFGNVYFAKMGGEKKRNITFDVSRQWANINEALLLINISDDHPNGADDGIEDDVEWAKINIARGQIVVDRDEIGMPGAPSESYGPFNVMQILQRKDGKLNITIKWKDGMRKEIMGSQKDFLGDFYYGMAELQVTGDLIPIPQTLWLFSSFLICLIGLRSRFKKR